MPQFNTSSGLSVETMARNIAAVVRSASSEQVSDGVRWYSEARSVARSLVFSAQENGVQLTTEQAAGIIAALSPRVQWSRNVELAFDAVAGRPVRCLSRSRDAALAIVHGAAPHDVLKGPKVRAFVEAVATGGRSGVAVVDVWAVRAATQGEYDSVAPSRYADIALAYAIAARRLSLGVHETQAIAWVVQRGGAS